MVAVVLIALTLPPMLRRGPGGRTAAITSTLVIVTGGAAVTFVAYLAFVIRCSQYGCHVRPGYRVSGIAPWWHVRHAWQWGAQLALAAIGLAVASGALALAARERRSARIGLNLARALFALWVVGVFAIPAAWEIFAI